MSSYAPVTVEFLEQFDRLLTLFILRQVLFGTPTSEVLATVRKDLSENESDVLRVELDDYYTGYIAQRRRSGDPTECCFDIATTPDPAHGKDRFRVVLMFYPHGRPKNSDDITFEKVN